MIFKFLHGSAYTSYKNYLLNYLFSIFCILFTVKKICQKWRKNIVEEISENDEEHNDENDENYDYITDRSFEAFVTVIEISIFGFENSTLVVVGI